jgi:glucan phosphoethanolaminetransferase (alkaline phosphatase superfamily)
VDEIDVRALNEAAAHTLASLLASVVAAIAVFILANLDLDCAPLVVHIVACALSGIGAAALAYVVLSLLIVVNLLWDALQNEQREAKRESAKGPR